MIVLGIDTSCDDTAVGIVENGRNVLSSEISSQTKIHSRYGGVIPELASREHLRNFIPVLDSALKKAAVKLSSIDLIAVTEKPGLPGGLLIGRVYAGALAYFSEKKLVETNHIHSHICAAYLTHRELKPPFFALVVSGGHTSMMDVAGYNNYKVVGETRDDAAGEAFDKVGNMLGLKYPGGIEIDKLSELQRNFNISSVSEANCFEGSGSRRLFPAKPSARRPPCIQAAGPEKQFAEPNLFTRPYLPGTPDFSFSGIKTQAMYLLKKTARMIMPVKRKIAYEFSEAVTDVLVGKTVEYAAKYGRKKIVVSGGVAANSMLRMKFSRAEAENKIRVYFPEKKYCTDNGAMVASNAYWKYKN